MSELVINGRPRRLETFECTQCERICTGQCISSATSDELMCRQCYILEAHRLAELVSTYGTPAHGQCFICRESGQCITYTSASICEECYYDHARNETVYAIRKLRDDLEELSALLGL